MNSKQRKLRFIRTKNRVIKKGVIYGYCKVSRKFLTSVDPDLAKIALEDISKEVVKKTIIECKLYKYNLIELARKVPHDHWDNIRDIFTMVFKYKL